MPEENGAAADGADLEALSFEELMERLEAITDQLASGDVGIERAAELYEEAEGLHAAARRRLDEVQARIARLGGAGADT